MNESDLRAELAVLSKRLEREKRARNAAEDLAEKETRQLYERQCELELLHRITDAANGAASVHDALQVTLDAICAYTRWPVGHAYFVDQGKPHLRPSKIWHFENEERFAAFREVTEARRFTLGEGLPGSVWLSGGPVWIPDVQSAPNFPRAEVSVRTGIAAAFAFPVLAGATITAVLEFFSAERVEKHEAWLKIAVQAGIQLGRIFERQQAAAALEKAARELSDLSRSAGMAEVATGVLHNVGNVLNSVSVSATILSDRLKKSKAGNLKLAAHMLKEKNGNLAEFLRDDPKGRMLPDYLARAAEQLEKEQIEMAVESASLHENIQHIKSIVAMQQDYAKVAGLAEEIDPAGLVNDALRMHEPSFVRHGIEIVREFAEESPRLRADRHQVMQILINLLRNAKHALEERPSGRRITVGIRRQNATHGVITVLDNGVGIPAENLTRIFNYGFTTKADGHGFGLHSGANVAREMGGQLLAHSAGANQGATFTLEVPLAARAEASP